MKTFELIFESSYSDEVINIIKGINEPLDKVYHKENVDLLARKVHFDDQDKQKVDELNNIFTNSAQ